LDGVPESGQSLHQRISDDAFRRTALGAVRFALGCAHDIDVSRPTNAPDFLFEANGQRVWVEATTANVSEKYGPPKESTSFDESYNEMQNVVPIRFAGPLTDKLKKRYWQNRMSRGTHLFL
jgi:hypothetical protein